MHPRLRPRPRALGLLAAAVLLLAGALAGCGDDDDGGDPSSGSSTSTTKGSTSSTEGSTADPSGLQDGRSDDEVATDKRLALSILLTTADLPDGYSGETDDGPDSGDDATLDAAMYDCMGVERSDVFDNDRATADSGDFAKEQAYVGSSANVYPDEAYAEAAFAPFLQPEFEDCFREVAADEFRDSAEEDNDGVEFTDVTIESLDFPDLGDATAAFRLVLQATYQGTDFESYADFVQVRVGRIGLAFDYGNLGAPFDAALARELARTVVDRADQAAGN